MFARGERSHDGKVGGKIAKLGGNLDESRRKRDKMKNAIVKNTVNVSVTQDETFCWDK